MCIAFLIFLYFIKENLLIHLFFFTSFLNGIYKWMTNLLQYLYWYLILYRCSLFIIYWAIYLFIWILRRKKHQEVYFLCITFSLSPIPLLHPPPLGFKLKCFLKKPVGLEERLICVKGTAFLLHNIS